MKIDGRHYRTIWVDEDDPTLVRIIDQRSLPHYLVIEELRTVDQAACAIREMHVRGAPLIGATAAYGLYLATLTGPDDGRKFPGFLREAVEHLQATRPTAVDLFHALRRTETAIHAAKSKKQKVQVALKTAHAIANESEAHCRQIGEHGLTLIEEISLQKNRQPVNILTHCNAGWMACIDYGTATAPIYLAHDKGIPVHVWVDETRPRNQGSRITAYELLQHGVPHTVITDNAGGHLMQNGMVDIVLVGSDRTTATGEVANKIGTYLKALAAKDNNVPFYVALPSTSIDWDLRSGKDIPIEERSAEEVKYVQGWHNGKVLKVLVPPSDSPARNFGFDVTPAHLVTGLITERGICEASEKGLLSLYPESSRPGHD